MKKFWELFKKLIEKWLGKDDNETPETPDPEEPSDPETPSTPVVFTPILVAGPIDSGVINWTSGVTVGTENYVKDLIGGRDKGTSISVISMKFTNKTTGKTFTYEWSWMWDTTTNTPKAWDWSPSSAHFASPSGAQNWNQTGQAYTTGRKENQALADGTRRGYAWFPYECGANEVVDVALAFKASENRGTAYITLCTTDKQADGKHVNQTIYKLNQYDASNPGKTWVTIATGVVFAK